jgi:hypothetical protein
MDLNKERFDMLDSKLTELAGKMIKTQLDERTEQLARDISQAQAEATMRGMGRSGAVLQMVYDICARDIGLRALIVWQNLLRVLSEAGVQSSEGLVNDLKEEVSKYRDAIYSEPYNSLQKVIQNVGVRVDLSLTDALERAITKVNTEAELFALKLQRYVEMQGNQSSPVFNFYSPVGAVQTGPSAIASVVQNLGAEDRKAILDALQLVRKGLDAVETLPALPKEEIVDLAAETQAELDKAKPNNTRLRTSLVAIATAIQTVANLQPAYQAIKTALLPLGISLP